MAEWRLTNLDDVVRLQRGHDLPSHERRPGSIPVVGAAGPSGLHDCAVVKGPGVVLGRAGASMGKATYVASDFWPLNTSLFATDFRGNNPYFVYLLLSLIDFSGYNSGAAQPMLNRNYIKHIELRVPTRHEQDAIALTLGALDDKIAVNGRIASISIELARLLYRKSVSDGFELARLGEIVQLAYGKALREPDRLPGTVRVYGCTGPVGVHNVSLSGGPSAVVGRKGANAGWVSWSAAACWVIDTAFYVIHKDQSVSPEVALFMLENAGLPGLVGDSAVPGLNREAAHSQQVTLPPIDRRSHLASNLRQLLAKSVQCENENVSLAALRDILLPKLMSGELRVRDAEQIVGDAT